LFGVGFTVPNNYLRRKYYPSLSTSTVDVSVIERLRKMW